MSKIVRTIKQKTIECNNAFSKNTIRLCRQCVHHNKEDDTCQALRFLDYTYTAVCSTKTIICRSREDMCGFSARYYEPKEKINEKESNVVCTIYYDKDGSSSYKCHNV